MIQSDNQNKQAEEFVYKKKKKKSVGAMIKNGVGKASYQKQPPAGKTYLRGKLVPMKKKVTKKKTATLTKPASTKFTPYYGGKGGKMSNGRGWGGDKPMKKKGTKTKPQGKGIVKALGQKNTTGNFKKIEKAKGKGAAIGALENKLAARRGQPIPYGNKKKKTGKEMLKKAMKGMC